MSRTHSHVPDDVEIARANPAILRVLHRHWVTGVGPVSCPDPRARCEAYLPSWASRQPWARHGTWCLENRAAVRDTLKVAAKLYRTAGQVDVDLMPDPLRVCLCQACGD